MLSSLLLAAVASFSTPDAVATVDVAPVVTSSSRHGRRYYRRSCPPNNKRKPVPEPMTMSLLGLGGAGLIGAARRRKRGNAAAEA